MNSAVRLLYLGVVKSGAYLRAHTVKIFIAQQRLLPKLLLSKGGAFFKASIMVYKLNERVMIFTGFIFYLCSPRRDAFFKKCGGCCG